MFTWSRYRLWSRQLTIKIKSHKICFYLEKVANKWDGASAKRSALVIYCLVIHLVSSNSIDSGGFGEGIGAAIDNHIDSIPLFFLSTSWQQKHNCAIYFTCHIEIHKHFFFFTFCYTSFLINSSDNFIMASVAFLN